MIDQANQKQNTLDEENDFVIDPSGATGHKGGQTRGLIGQPIGGDAFGGHMTRKPKPEEIKSDDDENVVFNDI